MSNCKGVTLKGELCKNKGSNKPGHNPSYCFRHQPTQSKKTPTPSKQKTPTPSKKTPTPSKKTPTPKSIYTYITPSLKNLPKLFSSPSNGSPDLYGIMKNDSIGIYSSFDDDRLVWASSDYMTIDYYKDKNYYVDPDMPICAVIKQKPKKYLIAIGSTLFSLNGKEITDFQAKVGNSNVSYISGVIDGVRVDLYAYDSMGVKGLKRKVLYDYQEDRIN